MRQDKKSASKMTLKRYRQQKVRGSQGFGYISVKQNGEVHEWGRAKDEQSIVECMEKDNSPSFMFHHRYPTSTPNLLEATHPIKVSHEKLRHDYYVTHNGIISNDDDLKVAHDLEKFEYQTRIVESFTTRETTYSREMFNDSEAFAIELAKVLDGSQKEINAKGSIAFIALQVNKDTQKVENVFYGRNYSNPLKCFRGSDFFTLCSEGKGESIEADRLYRYDWVTQKVHVKDLLIGITTATYDKGRYERSTWNGHDTDSAKGFMGFRTAEEEDNDTPLPASSALKEDWERYGKHSSNKTDTLRLPVISLAGESLKDEEEEFEIEDTDAILCKLYDEAATLESEVAYYRDEGMRALADACSEKLKEVNTKIWEMEDEEIGKAVEHSLQNADA